MKDTMDDEQEHLIRSQSNCCELIYNTKCQIVMVLILCAFIGIGTPFIWSLVWSVSPNCCTIESDLRYECMPMDGGLTRNQSAQVCAKLAPNCCWQNDSVDTNIHCYYALVSKNFNTKMPGYIVLDDDGTDQERNITLKVNVKPDFIENIRTEYEKYENVPVVTENLTVTIHHYSDDYFSIKIKPKDDTRTFPLPSGWSADPEVNFTQSNAEVFFTPEETAKRKTRRERADTNLDTFTLLVRRRHSDEIIFNTGEYSPFIFTDQYIEITTLLPNDLIYGLGQSPSRSFKHNLTVPENWAIFNKYNLTLTTNQTSWFGAHPFYMGWTEDNKAYGVLLASTFPMQVSTNSRPSLTFRVMGGHLDFRFFLGPTPRDVLRQLYTVVGAPFMPPYWSLGFHMCRTQTDLNLARETKERMENASIPFDSDCGSAAVSSILFSSDSYKDFMNFTETNTEDNRHTIVVQVPHKPTPRDPTDTTATKDDTIDEVAARWATYAMLNVTDPTIKPYSYVGRFYDWGSSSGSPNKTVIFPSYTKTEAMAKELMKDLSYLTDKTAIHSAFLDYNTPLDLSATTNKDISKICPYINNYPWNKNYLRDVNTYSPCLDLDEPGTTMDTIEPIEQRLAAHNLYGYHHMQAVKSALEQLNTDKRTLVMSLSTFIGSGKYGGHIGTNMNATWSMLRQSHIQTLEFNMYGIPLTGFPVCGFVGQSADEELCLRWYQLAAFQPFMISHRDFGEKLTDPYSVVPKNDDGEADPIVLAAIKSAITIRYQLLPYIYTQFYRSAKFLEPVVRPLFYDFPHDDKTYRNEGQYMFGEALMVSPVVQKNTKSSVLYFPCDQYNHLSVWYDYYSGRRVAVKDDNKLNISAIENHINLHIRGGHVIATQPVRSALNTHSARQNSYELIAALAFNKSSEDEEVYGYASGELFIDDGISKDTTDKERYLLVNFEMKSNSKETTMTGVTTHKIPDKEGQAFDVLGGNNTNTQFERLKVYGIIDKLDQGYFYVYSDVNCSADHLITNSTNYLPDAGAITLMDLPLDFAVHDQFCIKWTYTDWTKQW